MSDKRRRTLRPASQVVAESLERRQMLSSSLSNGVLTITGGAGNDIVSLRYTLGATNLSVLDNGVTSYYAYASISEIQVDLGDGNDQFDGWTTITKLTTIHGGAGNDTLRGSAGVDVIYGEDGNDVLLGRNGADEFFGGDGVDTIDYTDRSSGNPALTISLDDVAGDGAAGENDNIASDIERVMSGVGDDLIIGNAGNNYLHGGSGDDTIQGGDGSDTLVGANGADDLDGGDGIDTADYSAFNFGVRITLDGVANDYDSFNNENCRATNEIILCGAYADSVVGSANNETIIGQGGNDTLLGGDGDDSLDGGNHNDYLDGGAGNDTLVGGKNNDTLIGGDGADTFYSSGDSLAIDVLYFELLIDSIGSSDLTDLIIPV